MKVDITNICVALFFAMGGMYLGASWGSFIREDIFSFCGIIISIGTLLIANKALNTWKNQFRFQEQYKSLVNAEVKFKNYCISESDLRSYCLDLRHKGGVEFDYSDSEELQQRKFQFVEYLDSWNELKIHCPDFEVTNEFMKPDILSGKYTNISMELSREDYIPYENQFDNWHHQNFRDGVHRFQIYRSKIS